MTCFVNAINLVQLQLLLLFKIFINTYNYEIISVHIPTLVKKEILSIEYTSRVMSEWMNWWEELLVLALIGQP